MIGYKTGVLSILCLILLVGCGGGGTNSTLNPNPNPNPNPGSSNQNAILQRVATLTLNSGEHSLYTAAIDPDAGYIYFATVNSAPRYIIKVALGAGASAPVRIASVALPPGQDQVSCAVIDSAHGYGYFGTGNSPGTVLKVALGSGNAPPAIVGALTLNPGENSLAGAAIDTANGYAYFGCATSPGTVVKVALGAGNALPTRVGAVTLNPGENHLRQATIDPANGYVYFANGYTTPGIFVKVALGAGNSPPTRVGSVILPAGEDFLDFAEIDTNAGYAYLGTVDPGGVPGNTTPGKIIKIRLNPGDTAPTRIGSLTLPQKFFTAGGLDPTTRYLYVGNDLTLPASDVLQIAVGQGDALPTLVNTIQLAPGEEYIRSGGIDPARGYLYFGTDTYPGQVIKVAIPAR